MTVQLLLLLICFSGRTKLEPIAIVILSVIMSLASIQLIVESSEKIAGLATGGEERPDVGITTIVLLSCTIGKLFWIPLFLRLFCFRSFVHPLA